MLFNKFLIVTFLAITAIYGTYADNKGYLAQGTNYEKESIQAYALKKHGSDEVVFLDPFFTPYLIDLKDQNVLDARCGVAPWFIVATQNGARVYGIDLQKKHDRFCFICCQSSEA